MALTQYDIFIRLLVGLGLSVLIGLERELKSVPAGLRTHALVGIGATLFTVMSLTFQGPNVDVSRVAAQIVIGIGFIGGGVIFKSENKVKGMTTAAGLWVVTAIGIAAGLGEFFAAAITTAAVLLLLVFGRIFETKTLKKRKIEW